MDNSDFDRITGKLMANSTLRITDDNFDNMMMEQIIAESTRMEKRRMIRIYILAFAGIELVLFLLCLVLVHFFPVHDYLKSLVNGPSGGFHRLGSFIMQYDFLIVSLAFVLIIERLFRVKTPQAHKA